MMSVESIDFSDNEGENGQSTLLENGNNNQSLDSLMEDLGNMVKTPQPNNNDTVDKMRFEYEKRIESMEKHIKMLEMSLDNEINSPNGTKVRRSTFLNTLFTIL